MAMQTSFLARRPNIEVSITPSRCSGSPAAAQPARAPPQILHMDENYMEFELTKSDTSMANALRRVRPARPRSGAARCCPRRCSPAHRRSPPGVAHR